MDCSSSSRVPVEYHDPFSVGNIVLPHLEKLLPLRDLHWTSPSHPTRTIDSLYIHFQPDSDIIQPPQPVIPAGLTLAQAAESASSDTVDAAAVAADRLNPDAGSSNRDSFIHSSGPRFPVRTRRHQIPGLRQAPQVKILLFRCDDPETYKLSLRKYVKEWIRINSASSRSSTSSLPGNASTETHEAFEWMIVHVVIPDTPASAQPRFNSGVVGGTAAGAEKQSTTSSLWSSRGSSLTLFEKLRQDFNSTGKGATDRICQVRLQKTELPPDFSLPPPSGATSVVEKDQEILNAWSDVSYKIKALILAAFDRRVAQYVEDIKERDDRRSIPGWNFCTYFILKEGLARGYESMGLIEDALHEYGDLSVGLNWITSDIDNPSALIPGVNLLSYTDEFRMHYLKAIAHHTAGTSSNRKSLLPDQIFAPYVERPIFAERKHYRQMILSNNISLFDFRLYIFARHATLMLRMSEPARPIPPLGLPFSADDPAGDTAHLTTLADLCKQTVMFLAGIGAVLREDIIKSVKSEGTDGEVDEDIMENLVASWCYSAADQILQRTSCLSLPFSSRSIGIWVDPPASSVDLSSFTRPPRSSSLTGNGLPVNNPSGALRPGVEEYSAARGELILYQRRLIENLAERRGWVVGLRSRVSRSELEEVSLDGGGDNNQSSLAPPKPQEDHTSGGLYNPALTDAMDSFERFRSVHKSITTYALKHFQTADQTRTCEQLIADIAVIKYDEGDYSSAIQYFSKAHPAFGTAKWSLIESSLLQMHADCARKLNRKDDYVMVILRMLAKCAAQGAAKTRIWNTSDVPGNWVDFDSVPTDGLLKSVIEFAKSELSYEIEVSFSAYFSNIQFDRQIHHLEGRDGFRLRIDFTHLLPDPITFDSGTVQVKGLGSQDGNDFSLNLPAPVTIRPGKAHVYLESFACASGLFSITNMTLKAGNIVFCYDPRAPAETTDADDPLGLTKKTDQLHLEKTLRLHCYPHVNAFNVELSSPRAFRIDSSKDLEVKIQSGWNDIIDGEIRVRSRTAGLRLYTAETKCRDGSVALMGSQSPGVIPFGAVPPSSVATLLLPFTVEVDTSAIVVQFSITYRTKDGKFGYHLLDKIPVGLTLDVNVQDCFKAHAMFPNFTVRSVAGVPVRISRMDLDGLGSYEVASPPAELMPMIVYPDGCASMQYKISPIPKKKRIQPSTGLGPKSRQPVQASPMNLTIEYHQFDEEIVGVVLARLERSIDDNEIMKTFRRLLLPIFTAQLRSRINAELKSIATASIRHRFWLGTHKDWSWPLTLESLPENPRRYISNWFAKWHQANAFVDFNKTEGGDEVEAVRRRLDITVPIPSIPVACTTRMNLRLDSDPLKQLNAHSGASDVVVAVGVPVEAEITVRWTSRWDFSLNNAGPEPPASSSSSLAVGGDGAGAGTETEAEADIPPPSTPTKRFVYQLDAAPDAWLIGGGRRRHFSLAEDDVATFVVTFVPLRAGQLMVPAVEIFEIEPGSSSSSSATTAATTAAAATAASHQSHPSGSATLSAPPRRSRSRSASAAPPPPPSFSNSSSSPSTTGPADPHGPAVSIPIPVRVETDNASHCRFVTSIANVVGSTVVVGRTAESGINLPGTSLGMSHVTGSGPIGSSVGPSLVSVGPVGLTPPSARMSGMGPSLDGVSLGPGGSQTVTAASRWSVGSGLACDSGPVAGFAGGVVLMETEERKGE